ncbi:hypothetical protein RISK_001135 [Rhodopirellula islandica]|uniref:Uncharacterized protein n=1 Tax=Rhodopirellula islandica TaxID=595434 RepID=A0A0J1BJU1_RHOIS|nr:hypothetical protein RISK_001135 [Rhodopirellula islandica]
MDAILEDGGGFFETGHLIRFAFEMFSTRTGQGIWDCSHHTDGNELSVALEADRFSARFSPLFCRSSGGFFWFRPRLLPVKNRRMVLIPPSRSHFNQVFLNSPWSLAKVTSS